MSEESLIEIVKFCEKKSLVLLADEVTLFISGVSRKYLQRAKIRQFEKSCL